MIDATANGSVSPDEPGLPEGAPSEPETPPDAEQRPDIDEIAGRYAAVRDRVAQACDACGRSKDDVAILLAAKFQEPERVVAALGGGARRLGHNYVQQLEASEEWLSRTGAPPHRAHVIGHVQANKAAKALQHAQCIETVDSVKLARRLDRLQAERVASGAATAPFDIMLQVNSSGAPSQFGLEPEALIDVAGQITELTNLRIAGLMIIGAHTPSAREVAASFARARVLGEELRAAGVASATELSMGMTADMEIAIAEGSTQVRVGTAVFGPRPSY
ncbi:MAG: YggS family pyridoxal phosphate-dependent enzyme [Actinomycetaceae bacterium]|nr:YggS family pyridoxal phosphate-dependent enzyme [Actinomycetaceae bacterium]